MTFLTCGKTGVKAAGETLCGGTGDLDCGDMEKGCVEKAALDAVTA
ncbi:MAG: hypothetical protein ACI4V2_08880 [Alloprevotella sp.]